MAGIVAVDAFDRARGIDQGEGDLAEDRKLIETFNTLEQKTKSRAVKTREASLQTLVDIDNGVANRFDVRNRDRILERYRDAQTWIDTIDRALANEREPLAAAEKSVAEREAKLVEVNGQLDALWRTLVTASAQAERETAEKKAAAKKPKIFFLPDDAVGPGNYIDTRFQTAPSPTAKPEQDRTPASLLLPPVEPTPASPQQAPIEPASPAEAQGKPTPPPAVERPAAAPVEPSAPAKEAAPPAPPARVGMQGDKAPSTAQQAAPEATPPSPADVRKTTQPEPQKARPNASKIADAKTPPATAVDRPIDASVAPPKREQNDLEKATQPSASPETVTPPTLEEITRPKAPEEPVPQVKPTKVVDEPTLFELPQQDAPIKPGSPAEKQKLWEDVFERINKDHLLVIPSTTHADRYDVRGLKPEEREILADPQMINRTEAESWCGLSHCSASCCAVEALHVRQCHGLRASWRRLLTPPVCEWLRPFSSWLRRRRLRSKRLPWSACKVCDQGRAPGVGCAALIIAVGGPFVAAILRDVRWCA